MRVTDLMQFCPKCGQHIEPPPRSISRERVREIFDTWSSPNGAYLSYDGFVNALRELGISVEDK